MNKLKGTTIFAARSVSSEAKLCLVQNWLDVIGQVGSCRRNLVRSTATIEQNIIPTVHSVRIFIFSMEHVSRYSYIESCRPIILHFVRGQND
jgi:hypothetical protein